MKATELAVKALNLIDPVENGTTDVIVLWVLQPCISHAALHKPYSHTVVQPYTLIPLQSYTETITAVRYARLRTPGKCVIATALCR